MLADETRHAREVPERVTGEEALVDDRGVVVDDDCIRDVPPLPPRAPPISCSISRR
jgi:hypothetical protein